MDDLLEQLADAEHASWARWMDYLLFRKCERTADGGFVISAGYAAALKKQVDTPYADLSEQEKDGDRDEVRHILPLIEAKLAAVVAERDQAREERDDMEKAAGNNYALGLLALEQAQKERDAALRRAEAAEAERDAAVAKWTRLRNSLKPHPDYSDETP